MTHMTKATKKVASTAPAKKIPAKAKVAESVEKIGKTEIVDTMSSATLSKRDATAALDATLEIIIEALKAGKSVGLPGFGTLSVKDTAARVGVKPGTAEKIQIAAGRKVSYKVALDLKKTL